MGIKFKDVYLGQARTHFAVEIRDPGTAGIRRIFHQGKEIARMQEGYLHAAIVLLDDGPVAKKILHDNGITEDIKLKRSRRGPKMAAYGINIRPSYAGRRRRRLGWNWAPADPARFNYLADSTRVGREDTFQEGW